MSFNQKSRKNNAPCRVHFYWRVQTVSIVAAMANTISKNLANNSAFALASKGLASHLNCKCIQESNSWIALLPAGFVRVIDNMTIGFADFAGNRQYISVGNLRANDRVSLFFMDYANQTRLKLLGRVRLTDGHDAALLKQLHVPDYHARVERGMIISVEGYDWICRQHITPRFTQSQVMSIVKPLKERLAELEAELGSQQAGSIR